jgi:hypothetical protein
MMLNQKNRPHHLLLKMELVVKLGHSAYMFDTQLIQNRHQMYHQVL